MSMRSLRQLLPVHMAGLALILFGGRASAQSEPCPAVRVPASNGSPFTCGVVPAPRQSEDRAPGAQCPAPASDVIDSRGNGVVATRVRDLTISSVAINNKPMKVRVILPRDYAASPTKTWPVLYLLTGHGASYESWTCSTKLVQYARELNVIIAMPEGTVGYMREANAYKPDKLNGLGVAASGVPGWYSDWREDVVQINNYTVYGPRVRMRLNTHHNGELRDILNTNFRANNQAYAVAGLSMGGFGATSYALSSTLARPFVAAAAFSGPLDTEFLSANIPYVGGVDMPTVIRGSIEVAQAAQGEYIFTGNRLWGEKTSSTWRAQNPLRRVSAGAHRLSTMPYYISAGQGDGFRLDAAARVADGTLEPVEAGAYLATQSFVAALGRTDSNLKREYFPQFGHNWVNWDVAVCRALSKTILPTLSTLDSAAGSLPLTTCPAANVVVRQ
jgi:S-formylglutathione hydrolase FrmB